MICLCITALLVTYLYFSNVQTIKTGRGLCQYTSKKRIGYIRCFGEKNYHGNIQDMPLSPANKFAFSHLAKNVTFTTGYTKKNIIAISSINPSEGKSTIVALLAMQLAKDGFSILLIDSDLRNPTLQKLFKINYPTGYSDVCANKCKIEDAIVRQVETNLDILFGGYVPPNIDELLSQDSICTANQQLCLCRNTLQELLYFPNNSDKVPADLLSHAHPRLN